MSASTAASLLRAVRELRGSIRHAWEMQRRYPDRASYYRGQRKVTLLRATRLLQWAREELATTGHSPRSYLVEFDMEQRRAMTAYREAAE